MSSLWNTLYQTATGSWLASMFNVMNEETEQRTAGYITFPLAVLDGWVGQNAQYLKWWTQLRREASWTDKTVWYNRQQVYLQARQVIVTVNSLVKQ